MARSRPNAHKFNAQRTTVDNITFASKAEARRYAELKLLEKAGEISHLTLQPRYELLVNGIKVGSYVGDFVYFEKRTKKSICEDVKGYDLPLAKWKRKHTEAQYGISIEVIRDRRARKTRKS